MDSAFNGRNVVLDRLMVEQALDSLASAQIAAAAAFAMLNARLDQLDGDADDEPNGDDEAREADGDTLDAAWIELTQMSRRQKLGPMILPTDNEDDEEDDPRECNGDADTAVDDFGCDPDEGV